MMKGIISILIMILLVSCSSLNYKANPSIRRECFDLLSVKIIVDMPEPIHFEIVNYEEGVIYKYVFNDGVIFFFEGSLMQFDIDTYIPQDSVHKKIYSIYYGEEHGKFWKKYIYDNVRLYYFDVNKKDKKKYDNIFNTIKIQKLYNKKL